MQALSVITVLLPIMWSMMHSLLVTMFMAAVCNAREAEALKIEEHGLRAVMIRTGIVLSRDGGAVAKLLLPFRMFAEYLFPMRSFLGHWAKSCIAPLFFMYQSLFSV